MVGATVPIVAGIDEELEPEIHGVVMLLSILPRGNPGKTSERLDTLLSSGHAVTDLIISDPC